MLTMDFDTIITGVFGIIAAVVGYYLGIRKEKNDLKEQRYNTAVILLREINSLDSKITILHAKLTGVTVGSSTMLGTVAKSAGLDDSSILYSENGMYYKFENVIKEFEPEIMINLLEFYTHISEANRALIRNFEPSRQPPQYSDLDAFKREIDEAYTQLPKVKSSLSEIIEESHKRQWWVFW